MKKLTTKDIDIAAKVLLNDEILAFPTETVYGVGVIYDSESAFQKLVELKKRPPNKPFALMCTSVEEALTYIEVTPAQEKLMRHFLPGEITFLVNAKKGLPTWVTLGTNVIGIRVPDSDYIRSLFAKVGKPCLVTSANRSGEPTSRYYDEVLKIFDGEVGGIVKGDCVSLSPTTIVDLTRGNDIALVRDGPVPLKEIQDYWRNESMKIAIGSDHAGFELKDQIKGYLISKGYDVIDEGTSNATDKVDYPDFGAKVAHDIIDKKALYGIVCCGSAEGISIAANKVKGIRCGIGYNDDVSMLLRKHNDANMIAFAGRFMTIDEVKPRIDLFLSTSFEGGRHATRVNKISALEEK